MHVLVNAAESVDGKLSTRLRDQVAISGREDFAQVEAIRATVDAVAVGVGTVLADDPSLTVDDPSAREDRGRSPQPARIVADSRARTPLDANVLDDAAPSFVLASDAAPDGNVRAMEERGVTVLRSGDDRVDLAAAFDGLAALGVETVLAEGGGELIFSLFDAGLVDELRVYVGSQIIGGREAPTLADGEGFTESFPVLDLRSVERLDDGVALRYEVV